MLEISKKSEKKVIKQKRVLIDKLIDEFVSTNSKVKEAYIVCNTKDAIKISRSITGGSNIIKAIIDDKRRFELKIIDTQDTVVIKRKEK